MDAATGNGVQGIMPWRGSRGRRPLVGFGAKPQLSEEA
jgi:hypothetical protein